MLDMRDKSTAPSVRIGEAAEALGVSVETVRRWEAGGTLKVTRSPGGQRLIAASELSRQLARRRKAPDTRPIVAQSARNRFAGIGDACRTRRRCRRRRGRIRSASARQSHDRGSRRRARSPGRRRGGVRRQGHQRRGGGPRSPRQSRCALEIPLSSWSRRAWSRCTGSPGQASSAASSPITVLAASSLKAALTAAAMAYQEAHPATAITFSFDASSALADEDRAGAAGRRLRVRRCHQRKEARRRRLRHWSTRTIRRQSPGDRGAEDNPARIDRRPTWRGPGCA